jgi:hypothetical protein
MLYRSSEISAVGTLEIRAARNRNFTNSTLRYSNEWRRCHHPDLAAPSAPRRSEGSCIAQTISPDRSNSIGLHRVTVRKIANNRLRMGPMEAIDGTPVIDIKPVICEVQAG